MITKGWQSGQSRLCNEATIETQKDRIQKASGLENTYKESGDPDRGGSSTPLLPCLLHLCHLAVPKLHLFIKKKQNVDLVK